MRRCSRVGLARVVAWCAVLVVAAGWTGPARSGEAPPPPAPSMAAGDPGDDGPDGPPMPDRQILDFQMWRVTQDLKLNDEDAARVFPRLRRLGEAQSQLRRDRMKLMRKLRTSVDKASTQELQDLVGQIRDTEVQRQKAVMDLEDSVMLVLSPRQQAQYLVSRERFLRDLHQMAEEARMRRFDGEGGDRKRPERRPGMGRPGGAPGGGLPDAGDGPPHGRR